MFSQHGQDLFVIEALGGLQGGYFLDSGASDGVRVSNTLMLERNFGWSGICVEPNSAFFAQLVRNRSAVCLNCCIFDRDDEVEFLEAGTLGGILESYDPSHLAFVRATGQAPTAIDGTLNTTRKTARSLRSILRDCAAPATIDYWSLDTEGSELAILKSFPFDEFSFRILTVEHNFLPVRGEIRRFLASRGYRLARELIIDDVYLREDQPYPMFWNSAALRRRRRR